MRPSKRPKYKLDLRKFDAGRIEKKEKDSSWEDSYKDYLFSKIKRRRR